MTDPIFDHDRLDVYRLSIEYVASSFAVAKDLNGCHRHARDQWVRAAQSIPLNILEPSTSTARLSTSTSTMKAGSQNQAVHLRTACAVLRMENQSSVPGDAWPFAD
jgi:transposase-like protein